MSVVSVPFQKEDSSLYIIRAMQTQPTTPAGAPNGIPITPYENVLGAGGYEASAADAAEASTRAAARQKAAQEEWDRLHPPTPPGVIPTPGAGGAGPLGGSSGWSCEYAAETGQEGEGCFNSFFFDQFGVAGGMEGAVDSSSILGTLTKILNGGVKGVEIGWGALESAGKFVGRNGGKFLTMLHDVSSIAVASLALQLGGTACVVGAVGATAAAPYAAPFVWFGCATFIFGNASLIGWSAYDLYKNASHIH
jgi:hypothetical protein